VGIHRIILNLIHQSERKQDDLTETRLTKTTNKIAGFSRFMLVFYAVIFVLWAIFSMFGLTDFLVYKPAHFFFGDYIYLEFYLRYGFLLICLHTSPFFLLTMLICGRFKEDKSFEQDVNSDSNADFTESKKKGLVASYWNLVSSVRMLFLPFAIVIGLYLFWDYVIPDFKMVQSGEYFTIEVESDRFLTSRDSQRRSLGYNYRISVPRHLVHENDIPQKTNYFTNDTALGPSFTLDISFPLYERINALHSYESDRFFIMPDGTLEAEKHEREYVIIQLHYLPNTKCLLGYTVVA